VRNFELFGARRLVAAHGGRRREAAVDEIGFLPCLDRDGEDAAVACTGERQIDHRVRSGDRPDRRIDERSEVGSKPALYDRRDERR
jgi:hypothetical protein